MGINKKRQKRRSGGSKKRNGLFHFPVKFGGHEKIEKSQSPFLFLRRRDDERRQP